MFKVKLATSSSVEKYLQNPRTKRDWIFGSKGQVKRILIQLGIDLDYVEIVPVANDN